MFKGKKIPYEFNGVNNAARKIIWKGYFPFIEGVALISV